MKNKLINQIVVSSKDAKIDNTKDMEYINKILPPLKIINPKNITVLAHNNKITLRKK